jgi:hypothetical protein
MSANNQQQHNLPKIREAWYCEPLFNHQASTQLYQTLPLRAICPELNRYLPIPPTDHPSFKQHSYLKFNQIETFILQNDDLPLLLSSKTNTEKAFHRQVLQIDNKNPVCQGYLFGWCKNTAKEACQYQHPQHFYASFILFAMAWMKWEIQLRCSKIIVSINRLDKHKRKQHKQDLIKYSKQSNIDIKYGRLDSSHDDSDDDDDEQQEEEVQYVDDDEDYEYEYYDEDDEHYEYEYYDEDDEDYDQDEESNQVQEESNQHIADQANNEQKTHDQQNEVENEQQFLQYQSLMIKKGTSRSKVGMKIYSKLRSTPQFGIVQHIVQVYQLTQLTRQFKKLAAQLQREEIEFKDETQHKHDNEHDFDQFTLDSHRLKQQQTNNSIYQHATELITTQLFNYIRFTSRRTQSKPTTVSIPQRSTKSFNSTRELESIENDSNPIHSRIEQFELLGLENSNQDGSINKQDKTPLKSTEPNNHPPSKSAFKKMIRRLYPNSSSTNYKHSNNTHSYNNHPLIQTGPRVSLLLIVLRWLQTDWNFGRSTCYIQRLRLVGDNHHNIHSRFHHQNRSHHCSLH